MLLRVIFIVENLMVKILSTVKNFISRLIVYLMIAIEFPQHILNE